MSSSVMINITRACLIYCEGPVLNSIQLSGIFQDSKTFVDMPMIYEPEVTLDAYYNITDPTNTTLLEEYLANYFLPPGSDLVDWVPTDYTESPDILKSMPDTYEYKQWTSDLNNLWLVLGRNISQSVVDHPEKHSFTPKKYPMIVPGGRFRESYYWDTYFIIRGLLICDMNITSYHIIHNFFEDVSNFGFIPNGGRIYYLDRSQPPLLSEMVMTYVEYMSQQLAIETHSHIHLTSDLYQFLNLSLTILEEEYNWWMNIQDGSMEVNLNNNFNDSTVLGQLNHVIFMKNPYNLSDYWTLNRYYSNYTTPRPESYAEDYENSESNSRTTDETSYFYHSIRAGAETGWDFSSRWIKGLYNISNIGTIDVIPVELNAYLYKFELNLAKINSLLLQYSGDDIRYSSVTRNYTLAAYKRYQAIQYYMWDNSSYHWRDFNISSEKHVILQNATDTFTSVAYYLPIWAGICPVNPYWEIVDYIPWERYCDTISSNLLIESLQNSTLLQPGGVLTTTVNTGQQWDAPNAWPPLVFLLIEGLRNLPTIPALQLSVSSMKFYPIINGLFFLSHFICSII